MGDYGQGAPTHRACMQDHRKLRVWRHAHDLALGVRRCCQAFPRSGYASLNSQMTRAAESVVFNIIEGCGSPSSRDFARFLDTSIKSTLEVEGQLELAKDYGIVTESTWRALSAHATEVRKMLWGFRAKVLASNGPEADRPEDRSGGKPRRPVAEAEGKDEDAPETTVHAFTDKRTTSNCSPETP
jgi:four helix bundle protein